MTRHVVHMEIEPLRQLFGEILHGFQPESVHVVFPEVLSTTAERICNVLDQLGFTVTVCLARESVFRELSPKEAAEYWVPSPTNQLPDTLVLFGAQPWESSFEDDYKIELEAMQNREALKARGSRLIFFEWPRGARLDREIDLTASKLATIFEKSMVNVYEDIRSWNAALVTKVRSASNVEIRCPHGTNIKLSIKGRTWLEENCQLGEQEPAIYLPGGEIYTAAHENSANGEVVFYYCGERRIASFKDGLLVAVQREDGTSDRERGEEMGVGSEPLCEFGIGTNPWAPPWQIGTIYEKSAGTVHVAVGGNAHFGGQRDSPRHADLVIRDPQVLLDGEPLDLPPAQWSAFEPRSQRD